ncbi:MAG: peptidase M48, partial [Deferrisomatales bacterium]
ALLGRVGYSPRGLVEMLRVMDQRLKPGAPGFGSTHPSARDRQAEVEPRVAGAAGPRAVSARQARFRKAVGGG